MDETDDFLKVPRKKIPRSKIELEKVKSTTFDVRKESLDAALDLIRKHRSKTWKHEVNSKISHLCTQNVLFENQTKKSCEAKLTNIQKLLHHLRAAIGRHNWNEAASYVDIMLNLHSCLLPVIWRTVFLIVMNCKENKETRLNNFLLYLGVRSTSEKVKFLEEMLTLPANLNAYRKMSGRRKHKFL